MIGKKEGVEPIFHYFKMRELIPDDHILKLIDKYVDFSFVRDRARPLYSHTGRPSVDPEVMVRMLLVGYLFGIKSERRLCEDVSMHVGYRWFAGLNMDDKVPDHSTFSKNRHGRFADGGLWEEIFDEIVRRCIEAGLVSGNHLTADGTLMAADAAVSSMEPIVVEMKPGEYLEEIDKERVREIRIKKEKKDDDPDGMRGGEFGNKGAKISNDTHRSNTDPDSRLAKKSKHYSTKLSYQAAYIMDNPSRVILDAAVSSQCGRRAEADLARDGLDRVKWKYGIIPLTLGADKGYATGQFIHDIYQRGITPHVPVWDTRSEHDRGIYTIEQFEYDKSNNRFTCPQGKVLKHHANTRQIIYRASTKDCKICPVKSECTRDRSRSLSFHIYREEIEKAKKEMETGGYKKSQRCRKKIEELFGESKEQMAMRRARYRGRGNVTEQVLLTAAIQNIKRLVKFLAKHAPAPAQVAAKRSKQPILHILEELLSTTRRFFEYCSSVSLYSFYPTSEVQ